MWSFNKHGRGNDCPRRSPIGYNQIFVSDAMAANSKDEHEASTKYVFPKIGLLRTTNEIISAMT